MPKEAISITLNKQNLLWLRGQVRATARRSVSELVDRLVTDARTHGQVDGDSIRSVVGSVRLPDDDPDLAKADARVRRVFPQRRATQGAKKRG